MSNSSRPGDSRILPFNVSLVHRLAATARPNDDLKAFDPFQHDYLPLLIVIIGSGHTTINRIFRYFEENKPSRYVNGNSKGAVEKTVKAKIQVRNSGLNILYYYLRQANAPVA